MNKNKLRSWSYIKIDETSPLINLIKEKIESLTLAINWSGDLLFAGNYDGMITIINTRTNKIIQNFSSHVDCIYWIILDEEN